VYSGLKGDISDAEVNRILHLLLTLGFDITHPLMEVQDEESPVLKGLNEFREHLGGRLTITLLTAIGKGQEVNEIDWHLLQRAAEKLKRFEAENATIRL
jgi:3-dehydroquinate synthase